MKYFIRNSDLEWKTKFLPRNAITFAVISACQVRILDTIPRTINSVNAYAKDVFVAVIAFRSLDPCDLTNIFKVLPVLGLSPTWTHFPDTAIGSKETEMPNAGWVSCVKLFWFWSAPTGALLSGCLFFHRREHRWKNTCWISGQLDWFLKAY